jgi:hypothetical protein
MPINAEPSKLNLKDEENPEIKRTQLEKALAESFQLQVSGEAIMAYKTGEYIKSALLSWSYIEEYFLPVSIRFIAKRLSVKLDEDIIEKSNAYQLIRYYLLISHDREMYDLLELARRLRNNMMHNIQESKSLDDINKKAKESAKHNLYSVLESMFDREEGKTVVPVLLIGVNARNELRAEMRKKLRA